MGDHIIVRWSVWVVLVLFWCFAFEIEISEEDTTVCNFTIIKLCIFSGDEIEISVEDSKTGV